jgi:hypothetical protein
LGLSPHGLEPACSPRTDLSSTQTTPHLHYHHRSHLRGPGDCGCCLRHCHWSRPHSLGDYSDA